MSTTTTYPTNVATFLQHEKAPLVDGPLHLLSFHTSTTGFTRNTYVGLIDNDGTSNCLIAEAAGPVQAFLHMLDQLGYRLEIVTFRQRKITHAGHTRYLSALEIDNGRFTHWSLGVGDTSETSSHQSLINAANALHAARSFTPESFNHKEGGDGANLASVTASELAFRRPA
ncbi:MAG: hypothetical protein WAN89_06665 [Lawsonella sp.]